MQQLINRMKVLSVKFLCLFTGLCLTGLIACAGGDGGGKKDAGAKKSMEGPARVSDAASQLKLPSGFSAVTLVDSFGKTRHIAVAPNGAVFVKLAKLKNGKGIYRLQDTNGDGKADKITGFGSFPGTGMAVSNGYLYASSDEEVFRFKLDGDYNVVNPDQPEKLVTGLLSRHEHEAKAIALDDKGDLFVNIGAYSNACQLQ
ncbi:MAG TPA: hypothetical protein VN824_20855, partial [Puia sp.]|nr:hypothetical protein [Puia sp.]